METQNLDLQRLIAIVRRRRNWVYFSFAAAIILATVLNLMPPTYEAKVTIQVKPTAKGLIDSSGNAWTSEELARQKMYTYAELLKSRSVVETAIEKLSPEQQQSLNYDLVVNQITVRPLKDTEILNMYVLAGTPRHAQELANALAVAFNERMLEVARAESKETRVFIGSRLAETKRDLDDAEKALVEYKKSNQVVAITEQTKAFVERQSILKRLEAENRMALEAARAKQQTPSIIVDTPVVQQYRARLAEQEVELAGLLKNLTDEHPRVVSLRAAIEESRAKLKSELARIADGEATRSEVQEVALQRINSQENMEFAKLPVAETRLARLMLNYSVAESVYTILAKRYEEARISEIMEPANIHIFDMAALPQEPVKPKKVLNLLIATFLGLFIGTMLAFIVEYFYKTIDTVEDLQVCLPGRVVGIIPKADVKRKGRK